MKSMSPWGGGSGRRSRNRGLQERDHGRELCEDVERGGRPEREPKQGELKSRIESVGLEGKGGRLKRNVAVESGRKEGKTRVKSSGDRQEDRGGSINNSSGLQKKRKGYFGKAGKASKREGEGEDIRGEYTRYRSRGGRNVARNQQGRT